MGGQSLAAWKNGKDVEKVVLEPFLSWDFILRARWRAGGPISTVCCMIRCALEKDHSGSSAEGVLAEHALKPSCESCLESQRSLCQSAARTGPGSPGVASVSAVSAALSRAVSLWGSDAETELVPGHR